MKRFPALTGSIVAALSLSACAASAPSVDDSIERINTRAGVTIRVIVTRPVGQPKAAAILFPGGSGKLGLWRRSGTRSNNFLVRSRGLFAERGILTITVDVPSDRRQDGLARFRDTLDHRMDIDAVLNWLRSRTGAPVWLVGTSRGTVSVSHMAAALPIDGIVLTSSVTRPSRQNPATALDGNLEGIRVPALLVHHKGDECRVTPPAGVSDIAGRLKNAPKTETLTFSGGTPSTKNPCRAISAHGFLGIEEQVVEAIVNWMTGR